MCCKGTVKCCRREISAGLGACELSWAGHNAEGCALPVWLLLGPRSLQAKSLNLNFHAKGVQPCISKKCEQAR